jgi:DNA-binding response OmpR family regulator
MKRIAVIDDEMEILNLLERFLSRGKKYDVRVYMNPTNALNDIKAGKFDLVLLDIMMPQMDGIETLKRIREENKEVKVVMMTAHSSLDRVLSSHKIGANDYILKPFKGLSEVERKIRTNL